MAISTFITPPPIHDGTVFGIPYIFDNRTDEYILQNGRRFNRQTEMIEYVRDNLATVQADIVLEQIRARRNVDHLSAVAPPTIMHRPEIEKRNRQVQLKWDKEFNAKVLNLVTKVIEQGQVHVAKMDTINLYSPDSEDKYVDGKVEHHTITYPKHMERSEAYHSVRAQAEKIIRTTMPPPMLIPIED
jgi:hypothetical protein